MHTHLRFASLIAIVGLVCLGGGVLAAAGGASDVAVVRQVTARFHDVDAAEAAGYELGYVNGAGNRIITGCIAHPTAGVMGYHYFNKKLIDDLVVDEQQPEGLVYTSGREGAQARRGRIRRTGCRLEPARRLPATTIFGMQMHILVPAVGFYIQHVWVWSHNPAGMFVDWNSELTCP